MILEIVFGVYAIVSIFIVINLTRKIERLEDWGELLATRVVWVQDRFKEIDSKGHFESDDEVGTIFSALKDVSQVLSEVLEEEDQNG
ncbi:MAG TPA: hypothetical protein QF708_04445 [Candidatus Poseidoniia archaeon]|jgi:hypothetical protein|nr:hypothetical protein [Candidatus Poseidoniia archaeon]|tara:strand:- start:126 stop:386 length:261 start_codon:yes stop_codon:yes gene_type:complete